MVLEAIAFYTKIKYVTPLSTNYQSPTAPFQIKAIHSAREKDGIARLVISEEGKIIYANTHFKNLAHLNESSINANAKNIIRFEDNIQINDVRSGSYTIFLREDTIPLGFHFDWVDMPGGVRYLIASEINENQDEISADEREYFTQKIMQAPAGAPSNDQVFTAEKELITAMGTLKEQGDLRNFLNMSNEVMIVADENGALVRVNKSFHRLFGYKNNAFAKLNLMDLFEDSERPSIRNYIQNLTVHDEEETVGVIKFEASAQSQSNGLYWTEWRLQHRGDYIYCVGRDLSAAKAHEEELSKREHQLMEAELIGNF